MKKMSIYSLFLTLVLTFALFPGSGSGAVIKGYVYDKINGESLIGASIYLKENKAGTTTNIAGYFIIQGLKEGKYTVVVSYIGYKPFEQIITISGEKEINLRFDLEPSSFKTEEVVIYGDSISPSEKLYGKGVSELELSPAQINRIPKVVEADLLRALQTLPGITSVSDFSSALYVRGGTPDQNLYLIDGVDVYNPEHAFGIFSTFNTAAIKKVEVSKGGFGAEYGGRLSSVLDVTNLDGNRNRTEGVVNISLLSASTTLQMPIGKIGSLSGSFRRTYLDQTLSKWVDEVPEYYFYDGNLKAFLDLGENDKLTVSFFTGKDNLDYKFDKEAKESFAFEYRWGNTTGSLNWKHLFGSNIFMNFWVTGSRFFSKMDFLQAEMVEQNYLKDYAVKTSFEWYLHENLNFKFGGEHKFLFVDYDQEWDQGKILVNREMQHSSGFASMVWNPSIRWQVEAGIRYNHFKSDETFNDFEPRFSLKYRLDESSSLKLAAGRFHQYLNRIPRSFLSAIWSSSDKYNKPSMSDHLIFGYHKIIGQEIVVEAEVYYKTYKNLQLLNNNLAAEIKAERIEDGKPIYSTTQSLYNRGDGDSYGFELLVRKEMGTISGWVSYSYSKTENKFDRINGQKSFGPRHDRSHTVNAVANINISSLFDDSHSENLSPGESQWVGGLNFIYASGQPLTTPGSAYYANTVPDWRGVSEVPENNPGYLLYPGSINGTRLPAYSRLDFSLGYEKNYGNWKLGVTLQIYNIGNRKNIWFVNYKQEKIGDSIVQTIEEVNMLPLLPSLGFTITF